MAIQITTRLRPKPDHNRSTGSQRLWPLPTLVLTLTLTACSSNNDDPAPGPGPQPPIGPVALKQFTGDTACSQLETKVKQTVAQMMREQITRSRDIYGYPQPVDGVLSSPTPSPTAPEAGDAAGDSSGAGQRYSETNVQVAGVDEMDPVKNDGQYLYSLISDGSQIKLTQASLRPDNAMAIIGQASWPATRNGQLYAGEQPAGLFRLTNDRLVAVTRVGFNVYPAFDIVGAPAVSDAIICSDQGCGPSGPDFEPPRTLLRLFTTGANQPPAQSWQITVPGRLLDARRIQDKLYTVTEQDVQMPDSIRWWPEPITAAPGSVAWDAAWDSLIEQNTQAINNSILTDWLPPSDQGAPDASECQRYAFVDAPSRLGWLRVSTIDLNNQSVEHQTVMTHASTVYMSADALIIGTRYWQPWTLATISAPSEQTYLHRFALGDQGQLAYASSGKLDGYLINRFAIDEFNGTVRLAMAARQSGNGEPYSYLAMLREQGSTLDVIGMSEAIAPGETLRSARFVNERAYLVTAIVIDPFFVFDLSDPTQPRELGELKIPGFSSYLHPVGQNHVLGIGVDTVTGWPRTIKASLFNVTDPTMPVEQSVLLLGETFTTSEALWDPHAFTLYYPQAGSDDAIMAIPVRSYARTRYATQDESAIRLIDVRPDQGSAGLALRGTLDMTDLLGNITDPYGWRASDARRAVFIDDTVYGISDAAVRSAKIQAPNVALDTLFIP